MSEENSTTDFSRRGVLKTTGFGLAGTSAIFGSFADRSEAKADPIEPNDLPYDEIESSAEKVTVRYTKNALWHNKIKICVSSTVKHIGSYGGGDDRWNHKYGIDTHAVAYHTGYDELRANIKNQSTKVEKVGDSSLELNGKPVGSDYVGATPSNSGKELAEVMMDVLEPAVALLNQQFAVASAASTIAEELEEAGTRSCSAAADCTEYEWTYIQNKEEVAHQARWWATTGPDEWGNFELTTQADSETGISFGAAVGPDYGDIAPIEPPSSSGGTLTENGNIKYMTRGDFETVKDRAGTSEAGLPSPRSMSEETANKYSVEELDHPKKIVVNGKEKEVTHVAKDFPVQVFGLEPKEKHKQ